MNYLIAYSEWLAHGCILKYTGTNTCIIVANSQLQAIELFRKQYNQTYYKIVAITKLDTDVEKLF